MKIKFYFYTGKFYNSHLREPKGRGSWAFEDDYTEKTRFSPSMTYADAKKWIKAEIRKEIKEMIDQGLVEASWFDGDTIAISVLP